MNLTRLRRMLAPVAAATALTVAATLASVPQAGAAPRVEGASPIARAASAAVLAAVPQTQQRRRIYTPRTGVIHTDPRQADKRKLLEHIIKSIGSTRRRGHIRIISWNIASRGFVDKVIAAHKRGVSVRLLMAKGKAEGNADYLRLRKALRAKRPRGNRLPDRYRSWIRVCEQSCRGKRGIAHSKLFLFSKVGRARRVVMSTSANATEVAVNYQWNDLYTVTGSKSIYKGFVDAFLESSKDKPVKRGYREYHGKEVMGYIYPWKGANARGDRVMTELRRITCVGARGGTGVNGRTRIRIAQDAIIDQRGIEIGKILRTKWENGCNIRIVFALMGSQVRGILRHTSRGPVPMQQIVSDFDDDGIYDRYLHSKSMTVSGWYRKDRSARVAWQGSENWSGLAKLSDEQGFRIHRGGAEGVYARWVDYLFFNPPPPPPKETLARARAAGLDPYALIKEELGLPARRTGIH
jgi:hypothetical protein